MKPNYEKFDEAAPTKTLHRELSVKVEKVASETGDVLDIRASDNTRDRYNEVIIASGWKLDNYKKNPVIQNCHQYGDIIHTIGKALVTEVRGNDLAQRWKFASEVNPLAKIAAGMYGGGYLNACSVGFLPLSYDVGKRKEDPSRTYIEQELLECSAVGIPANPNALTLAYKAGAIEKGDLKELYGLLRSLVSVKTTADGAAEVIFHECSQPVTRLMCPHCEKEIHEKGLYFDGKLFEHRECGGKLFFPTGKGFEAIGRTQKDFCADTAGDVPHPRSGGNEANAEQIAQLTRSLEALCKKV